MQYQVEFTSAAQRALQAITDRRTRTAIIRRIEALVDMPDQQGSGLRGELTGFRSVRAAGQRYRILYRVDGEAGRVVVHLVGIRREGSRQDVYAVAERLLRRGFLSAE